MKLCTQNYNLNYTKDQLQFFNSTYFAPLLHAQSLDDEVGLYIKIFSFFFFSFTTKTWWLQTDLIYSPCRQIDNTYAADAARL